MKKKLTILLIIAILLVSMIGGLTASAGSGSVHISGETSVQAGKTYTYDVTVSLTDTMDYIGSISCSGIFSGSSSSVDFHADSNSSGTASGSITVTVSSNAQPGDAGTISVSGQGTTCVYDETGAVTDVTSFSANGSQNATVAAASTATASATKKPSSSTSATSKPTSTPEPTEWELAATSIDEMGSGGTLTIDITEDTEISASLLTALIEKQGTLTINFGTYTCTINSSDLSSIPDDLDSLDLSLNMEKDEVLSEAVGGADAYQLHFSHDGEFPGKITYSFKADGSEPGDTLYLYYYYSQAGIIEGNRSAVVDENGYVSFEICHCSSYFVSVSTIDGAMGSLGDDEETAQALQEALDAQSALEAELQEAQSQQSALEAELEDSQEEADQLTASVSGPASGILNLSIAAFVIALFAAVVLTIFATMFVCKVGIFNRNKQHKE